MTATITRTRRERAYVATGEIGRHLQAAHQLQAQIQALSQQYDAHRRFLLDHMQNQELDRIELGQIVVLRKQRANYTYSAKTEREMQRLRVTQKWEVSEGVAKNDPTVYIALSTKSDR